jgi:hypothetical protein
MFADHAPAATLGLTCGLLPSSHTPMGHRETPRRLRFKPAARERPMVGLCRPREAESPDPQGNPRPRRHDHDVGMTVVTPKSE